MKLESKLLLVHCPNPLMNPDKTGAALDALVGSGKVRSVGASNFRPWDFSLLQSRTANKLATNQIEISLMEIAPFTNGDLATIYERGVPAMAWSPLAGGRLLAESLEGLRKKLTDLGAAPDTDWSAVAVAWLLHHPSGILPVMGTNSLARIATASDALRVPMDRQTWFEPYTLASGREVP